MRPLFDDIMKAQGKWLRIYIGKSEVQDPYEKNTTVVNINPISVKAIIEDLTSAQAQWKMPGISVAKVKDITIDKKHRSLIEQSSKIEFEGEFYEGWKQYGKLQIREENGVNNRGYLRLYIYSKAS